RAGRTADHCQLHLLEPVEGDKQPRSRYDARPDTGLRELRLDRRQLSRYSFLENFVRHQSRFGAAFVQAAPQASARAVGAHSTGEMIPTQNRAMWPLRSVVNASVATSTTHRKANSNHRRVDMRRPLRIDGAGTRSRRQASNSTI